MFKPYKLADRHKIIKANTIQLLGQSIIEGDLQFEQWMIDELDSNIIKFKKITGTLSFNSVKLISLPKWLQSVEVDKNFLIVSCNLTSLQGLPKKIGGSINCSHNQLTSLAGSPEKVFMDFDCSHNQLTSLEGGPKHIYEDFACSSNDLNSLEGGPIIVMGWYTSWHNPIQNLNGLAKKIKNLDIRFGDIRFTESDIPSDTLIKGKIEL